MKKKALAKPNKEAMKKAEAFVRSALSALSNKHVSNATVRSVAKKASRAIPADCAA
jgi:hypothetical protein